MRQTFIGICLLFSLSLNSTLYAGTTGKITGQITDSDGFPLPGASIYIADSKRGTESDREGVYFLLTIEPGRHTVVASLIGYEPQRKEDVLVSSDYTTNLSFQLKEQTLQLGEIVVEAETANTQWGMFATNAHTPAIELDRTITKYQVRSEDIELLTSVRSVGEFVELQAGVSIDEEGNEILVRAGGDEDLAYYLDGVFIPGNDNPESRVYRNFNRLSIQEMTIITGGMDAEYGNAQGGVVSVVTREGGENYHGLFDYQLTPAGKKHWGTNVYDSTIHQGNARWHDSDWVSESVTLPDGRVVPAHERLDYTQETGHYIEKALSGPLTRNTSFFMSGRWQRQPAVFPGPHLHTPFNFNTLGKITFQSSQAFKVKMGALYDKRRGTNKGIDNGGKLDLRNDGRNLFLKNANPAGDYQDTDQLIYASMTHLLSSKTFYEITLSRSVSIRDTIDVPLPVGITHISEGITSLPILDQNGYYILYRDVVDWERSRRERWSLKADLSSQITKRHFFKTGLEVIRYNNWAQRYYSLGPEHRYVGWYGNRYEDTDFFIGQSNKGVNPYQMALYVQDKIELDGMIVNAGMRWQALYQNTWVTNPYTLGTGLGTMTRHKLAPEIKGNTIYTLGPRLGISHPFGKNSLIRFFYGKAYQFPHFLDLFWNSWISDTKQDLDLNENGQIDSGERWNSFWDGIGGPDFGQRGVGSNLIHNPYLLPEAITSFEVGIDWNLFTDYVFNLTTYYKGGQSLANPTQGHVFITPLDGRRESILKSMASETFRDIRGIELNLKKRFSQMFAFNFALNLQWSERGDLGWSWFEGIPDSLYVANGHYWNTFDIDPTTGAEIPISLREQAVREGKDPDFYITRYGAQANRNIQNFEALRQTFPEAISWSDKKGYYASEGFAWSPSDHESSFYSDRDKAYWERINADPNYPGQGEGNLLVAHRIAFPRVRESDSGDRRSFGSMAFLFATPPNFGPLSGKLFGGMRTNLVYRIYTGTPYDGVTGGISEASLNIERNVYGPIHTRIDLNLEKQFGNPDGIHTTLGIQVYNLFNQKDLRAVIPGEDRDIDLATNRWQLWGIPGLDPISARIQGTDEIFDINNYWDSPRELTFSLRVKW